MILGIGIEWVDVARFRALLARRGDALRRRVFTAGELAYASRRGRGGEHSLAVRFAAKLAARRALAARGLRWCDVEVVRDPGEAPALRFHAAAAELASHLGVERVALTLTHDAAACIGQVVLEGTPAGEGTRA
jgi:holo-[acyl-carrier protein] synthase